jgi:hypothetical protein
LKTDFVVNNLSQVKTKLDDVLRIIGTSTDSTKIENDKDEIVKPIICLVLRHYISSLKKDKIILNADLGLQQDHILFVDREIEKASSYLPSFCNQD